MIPIEFILVLLVLAIIAYILIYNTLVTAKQKVNEAWSDVDVQLKRRHDLIPNIVESVKAYAKHEKVLLEKVTEERAKALKIDKNDIDKLSIIENQLGLDLGQILMIAEAYPDLKASQNFLELQEELSKTEDQIASSRRIYNANVTDYNTKLQIFPLNIVATLHRFVQASFFTFKEASTVPSAKID